MSEFLMPSLGADMESAVLMEWHVKVGDKVKKGQVIAEVETSKGVIEIEVFEDGIVKQLLVDLETECKVGTPLAIISPIEKSENNELDDVKSDKEEEIEEKEQIISQSEDRIKLSPAARKKAKEMGVDLKNISNKENTIIHLDDILNEPKKVQMSKKENKDKSARKDLMRESIAAAMSRSNKDIPHYYLSTTINMTPALTWMEELNKNRSIKQRIIPAALLVYATVKILQEVPQLNGFWLNNEHKISDEIHPGVAISLRKGGLITPALMNANKLDLDQTMEKFAELISRTRSGKLKGSELSSQTITITNLGDLGVEEVFGIIYPPQVALIGFGKIHHSPWAKDDTLSVKKVIKVTLCGDHRATDGHTGAMFLDKLDKILQNPKDLL